MERRDFSLRSSDRVKFEKIWILSRNINLYFLILCVKSYRYETNRHFLFWNLFFLSACSTIKNGGSSPAQTQNFIVNGKLWAAYWQQHSAEYKALCFQAYNLARFRLDNALKQNYTKPTAIITDIDETVLDNSPNTVSQGLQGKGYEKEQWYNWTAKAKADTVPGAAAFLKYAASKSVKVFYISNRDEQERNVTLANLKKYDLPDADGSHLLLKQASSGKEERRQAVLKDYQVLLLLGDNLSDFSSLFDKQNEANRLTATNQLVNQFGDKFIVLPNAVYGDWESATFQYNYKLNPEQKEQIIKKALKGE